MIADDYVVANAAAANKTFSLFSQVGQVTSRIDNSTAPPTARLMRISHTVQGSSDPKSKSKTEQRDARLLSFEVNKLDTVGRPTKLVCNLNFLIPTNGVFTRAELDDLGAFVKNILTSSTFMDKFYRGEA